MSTAYAMHIAAKTFYYLGSNSK